MKINKIKLNRQNGKKITIYTPARIYRLQQYPDYKNNYTLYTSINEKNPLRNKKEVILIKDTEITQKDKELTAHTLFINEE